MSDRSILLLTLAHIILWIVIYRSRKQRFDVFDPFYLSSAIYILVFVYGPWVWLSRGQMYYQGVEVMSSLPKASMVFNIGFFSFGLGSLVGSNTRYEIRKNDEISVISTINYEYYTRYIVRYAYLVYFISMALSLLYYRLIGRSVLSLFTLGLMGETGWGMNATGLYFLKCFNRSAIPAACMLIVFSEKKGLPWICVILLSLFCISTGSRNLAISMILSIIVFRYVDNDKRPGFFSILLIIGFFYFLIGLVGTFRTEIKSSAGFNIEELSTESMYTSMMFNVEIFYPFYNLIKFIPSQHNYHYGLGILNIFVQFIPRALWPGKPTMLGETAFEAMYGNSMGGAAYPNIGEFYYEFGIIGVIVFMYFFGWINKASYQGHIDCTDKLKSLLSVLYFGYLIQFICRGHFASWAIDILFMLGPVILLQYLIRNRKQTMINKSLYIR